MSVIKKVQNSDLCFLGFNNVSSLLVITTPAFAYYFIFSNDIKKHNSYVTKCIE